MWLVGFNQSTKYFLGLVLKFSGQPYMFLYRLYDNSLHGSTWLSANSPDYTCTLVTSLACTLSDRFCTYHW